MEFSLDPVISTVWYSIFKKNFKKKPRDSRKASMSWK